MDNIDIDNQHNQTTKTNIYSMSSDFIAILVFVVLIVLTYKYNPFKYVTYNTLTAIRLQYSAILFLFLVLVFILYYYDLLHLTTNYFSLVTLSSLIVGCFLFAVVLYYFIVYSKTDIYASVNPVPKNVIDLFKFAIGMSYIALIILFVFVISFNTSAHSSTFSYTLSIIFNILLITTILTLVYKMLMNSPIIQSSPWFRLIVNTLLYIPCILAGVLDKLVAFYYKEKAKTNTTEVILLGISILLIVLYYCVPLLMQWVISTYQGGKILLNEPVILNQPYTIAGYMSLNDIDRKVSNPEYVYNYGMSLWLYLDAVPPNTSAAFNKYTPVFNYGGKPAILYKADNNTMMITAKIKDFTKDMAEHSNMDMDEHGDVIIYKLENVLLQKWNHLVINYSGGILDIFYNGELVKSAKNIVPYMELDTITIGDANGINGAICNVVYYKYTLDASKISMLYNSVKNKTPPTLSYAESNEELVKKNVQ